MEQILQDPKFAEWIKGSKVRTQLFVQADQQYDYDSAHELFSLWKERNQIVQQTAQAEKQHVRVQLRLHQQATLAEQQKDLVVKFIVVLTLLNL